MSAGLLLAGIVCMGICFTLPVLKCISAGLASGTDGSKDDKSKKPGA